MRPGMPVPMSAVTAPRWLTAVRMKQGRFIERKPDQFLPMVRLFFTKQAENLILVLAPQIDAGLPIESSRPEVAIFARSTPLVQRVPPILGEPGDLLSLIRIQAQLLGHVVIQHRLRPAVKQANL